MILHLLEASVILTIASVMLTIFALWLRAEPHDTTYLFHRPGQLLRSLLSMNVFMPLFTTFMTAVFHLHPVVETTLIALAVSPIPPLLPNRVLKAGGDKSYTIGLLCRSFVVRDLLRTAGRGPFGNSFWQPRENITFNGHFDRGNYHACAIGGRYISPFDIAFLRRASH